MSTSHQIVPTPSTPSAQLANEVVPCLHEVVGEVARDIQAPMPLVLNTTLAVMTMATQSLIDVVTPLGQVKPVSNFFIGIAESGNRKTAIEKALTRQIRAFEDAQQRRYTNDTLPAYQRGYKIWDVETTRLKRKASDPRASEDEIKQASIDLATHLQLEPVKPREPQWAYRDVTGPALMEGLVKKNRSAFVSSSDASGVLHGHVFRNLADLNQLWDGDTLLVNRVGKESLRITESRLTIDLAVQMGPYLDFLLKGDKARDTGFAARCLTCLPPSMMGTRHVQLEKRSGSQYLEAFHDRVGHLLEFSRSQECDQGFVQRQQVVFSEQAAQDWAAWINSWIEPELRPNGKWSQVADQASKMPEIVARLAAVISYFERGELIITLPTFHQARDIGMNYLDSYRDICEGQVEYLKRERIKFALESWIKQQFHFTRNQNTQFNQGQLIFVEKNKIRSYGPSQVRNKKVLDEALEMLSAEGKILLGPLSTFIGSRFPTQGGERTVVLPGQNLIGW